MAVTPTATQLKQLVRLGYAMPDGSYYIRAGAVGAEDLHNAILAVGRATGDKGVSDEQQRNAVRRHIMKRAAALKLTSEIPDTWNSDGTLKHSDEDSEEDFLEHDETEDYDEGDDFEDEGEESDEDEDLDHSDDSHLMGLSDEEFEDFLAHHGVKGMKWGVVHQRKLELYNRVASGKGSKLDTLAVHGQMSTLDHIKHKGSSQSFAREHAAKLQAMKDRVQSGNATRRDKLDLALNYSLEDAARSALKKPRAEHDEFSTDQEFLEHHGIEVMGPFLDLHNRAAQLTNAHDIGYINDVKYKKMNFLNPSPLRDDYYVEHAEAFVKNLNQAVRENPYLASLVSPYKIEVVEDGTWLVSSTSSVMHAENMPESFTAYPRYDSNGRVVKVDSSQNSLLDTLDSIEFIKHHGVKGMKWGVRKAAHDDSPHPDYTVRMRRTDAAQIGGHAVKQINRRMNAGESYDHARRKETHAAMARTAATAGGLVALSLLAAHGDKVSSGIHTRAETKRGERAFSNSHGLSNTVRTVTPKAKRGVYKVTSK